MIVSRLKRLLISLPKRLQNRGYTRLAEGYCRFVLWFRPQHPEILHQLALILAETERSGAAIRLLRQGLALTPDSPYLHSSLGQVLVACQRLEHGLDQFKQALALQPNLPKTRFYLGNLLVQLNQKEAAIDCFRQLIKQTPDFFPAFQNLGNILLEENQTQAAIDCFEQAIRLRPTLSAAYVGLGRGLTELGRFKEAEQALLQALQHNPKDLGGKQRLIQLKSFDPSDTHLLNLEQWLEEGQFEQADQIHLLFSLAKGYMGLGERQRGFDYLQRGNRLKRVSYDYHISQDATFFARILQGFTAQLFHERKGLGSDSQRPLFILGMPRSGTTLLEQMLSSHSQICGAGERSELWRMANTFSLLTESKKGFPEGVSDLSGSEWSDLAQSYEESVVAPFSQARYVTDKMPHNFLFIGLIHLLFPNAHIIHCRREPVDTCLSCYMQDFSGRHEYAYDLGELGAYYRLYDGLMNHWRTVLPNRLIEVDYESLVAEPETVLKGLLEKINLPWESGCLEFYNNPRSIRTASLVQVRQPLYNSSIGRWRHYEGPLQPLLQALGPLAPPLSPPDSEVRQP
ncbi:MAG: sulfotransferase [Magnetococcales bacterium]|nr:sulfotransferase [Magnetococcales bacterium]